MPSHPKQKYGVTYKVAKIDSLLDEYIRSHKQRGETYSDILRRLLGLPAWVRNSRGRPIGFRPNSDGRKLDNK